MSTVDRALSILELFTLEKPRWTVEEAARAINLPVSTVYRYCRSLSDAGLIVNFSAGRYIIGPAVIEMDRHTRKSDPLIVSAQSVLDRLARTCNIDAVALVCRMYRMTVMCVEQRANTLANINLEVYERGRPMPLFRGAPSRIIFAYLPYRIVKRAIERERDPSDTSCLANDPAAFNAEMRKLRKLGYAISGGDTEAETLQIAAPVFNADDEISASVGLVLSSAEVDEPKRQELIDLVISGGKELTSLLTAAGTQ